MQSAEANNLSKQNNQPLNGVTVLLVEDNELNILVARKFLEKWGAKAEVARNGMEAINLFNEEKHQIILMDLHMPVLDGYDTTAMLRKQGFKVPIIALTANIFSEDNKRIIANGISGVVLKPFEPASFLNTLLQAVEAFYPTRIAS